MSKSNPPSHMRLMKPTLRVLLVDDEPTVLRTLKRALASKRPDWQVTVQAGPAEALESLAESPVDVLVSDYEMPEMNGVELFRRVKRHHPTVLRVIMSGKSKECAGVSAPGLLHGWLPKTNTYDDLASALEGLLARRDRMKRKRRTG